MTQIIIKRKDFYRALFFWFRDRAEENISGERSINEPKEAGKHLMAVSNALEQLLALKEVNEGGWGKEDIDLIYAGILDKDLHIKKLKKIR